MRIWVTGPMGECGNDDMVDCQNAIKIMNDLIEAGHEALCPHLYYYANLETPDHFDQICLAWVSVADAVVALPGFSPPADRECARADDLGIPVYGNLGEFYEVHGDRRQSLLLA